MSKPLDNITVEEAPHILAIALFYDVDILDETHKLRLIVDYWHTLTKGD